jgi:hypothetical protein
VCSTANTSLGIPPWRKSLRWDEKWPLFLDAKELTRVFVSRYLNANYQNDPSEGPIFHAAEALADRHGVFFELLKARILVAGGTFTGTGQEMPIPEKQWSRKDRYLDVHHTDFFSQEGETVKALWESVTVHLPGPEAITRAADLPIVHPTSAPSPLPSAEKDASTHGSKIHYLVVHSADGSPERQRNFSNRRAGQPRHLSAVCLSISPKPRHALVSRPITTCSIQ